MLPIETLIDRALVTVTGEDAEHFLDKLITCNVLAQSTGEARFGALLTPQGKILFDFFLVRRDNGYLIDLDEMQAEEFVKRMMFFRLRAKVEIARLDGETKVYACMDEDAPNDVEACADPRHSRMGRRLYGQLPEQEPSNLYLARRIACSIPQGGTDFSYGDAYPHEVLMDQFMGVDFKKGCFVGQEVVSRMQHRGTTKKRIVQVASELPLPETGTDVMADGKPAGKLGSVQANRGLALLRLDRIAKAQTVLAGDVPITATIPDWVNFSWPEEH